MSPFQNRQQEIKQICPKTDQPLLLNIYGEAGIGKSRLLLEAWQRLRTKSPPPLVLQVNIDLLADAAPADQPRKVLQALIDQAQGQLSGQWQSTEQVAGQIVVQLSQLAERMPVYLMFDTTELLQEDMEFWRWMEANLVGPLAIEGQVRQIFAGRVPVPWRRVEVRRIVKLLPLDPLSVEKDARRLVQEVLQENNPNLKDTNKKDQKILEQAIDLVLEFSFGHPFLSEKLAAYAAPRWPASPLDEFKRNLCRDIVKPFIQQHFFKDIISPWDEILWWISVLNWFDATTLQQYLKWAAPELIQDKPDYFFIQGITRLRIHNTVVWREERGDRLHGVIGHIVRHCLEIIDPEQYRHACQSAAETLEALVIEFSNDDPEEAEQYRQEADVYRRQAKQEAGQ